MKLFSKNYIPVLLALLVIGSSFYAGYKIGHTSLNYPPPNIINTSTGEVANVDFGAFWRAWNEINSKFVAASTSTGPVTDQDKVWGAIAGLASSLRDPYTVFFPPVESKVFEGDISGNFEGVGMEIGVRDDELTVISPLKGTPAEKAGVRAGDKILAIDEKPTTSMTADEAVKLIRGVKGTVVKLVVLHEDTAEPVELSVTRDIIDIPTIATKKLPGGIFKIDLYNFSAISPNLFRGALREFITSGSNKLILDLRGNPGGYLEASIDMASWFLPPGKIVLRENFGEKQDEKVYRSKGYNIFNDKLKFVILVNGGSASASEILAGALNEYGIAQLVGEKTYGKGSVQELVKITPETSLKITIARWLTPNGISISQNGLVPDLIVPLTIEDVKAGKDPQLEKAIELLSSN